MGAGASWRLRAAGIALSILFAACSGRQPAPSAVPAPVVVPPGTAVDGVASWYGPGFNGRRTANGEIYNQEDMTAASNIFPLGTRLMVTNLENQRSVEVRVNDRGPFRKGRKLDLSHGAACVLGIVNPGTARCRMEVLSAPPGSMTFAAGSRYFVQVGSFAMPSNAQALRDRLAPYYSDVRIDQLDAGRRRYYRVRMGAFPTRGQAQSRAAEFARFGLPIIVVSE